MSEFLVKLEEYMKAVDQFIEKQVSKSNNLEKITFETEKQQNRKISAVLKNNYDSKLIGNNIQWKIEYVHKLQDDG